MKDGRTKPLSRSDRAELYERFFAENRAVLVVASGPAAGSEYEIDQSPMRLGRGPDVELAFDDDAMSSQHAAVELGEFGLQVRDLASTNGVLVNGARVEVGDLKHGDRLRVGEHEFRFLQEERERGPKTFVLGEDV